MHIFLDQPSNLPVQRLVLGAELVLGFASLLVDSLDLTHSRSSRTKVLGNVEASFSTLLPP
jgi:hypothetical protein